MARSCLVLATWLTYMLSTLPHTGLKDAAYKSLLDEFIDVLQSSKNLEEKILVTLAMKTFVSDPCKYNASEVMFTHNVFMSLQMKINSNSLNIAALEALGVYVKCIYRTLKKLKRNSLVVRDIMEALMNLPSVDAVSGVEEHSCP